jgi:hypothetical protein
MDAPREGSGGGVQLVSLNDLVDLDLAQGVFARFVDAINSHADQLAQLKAEMRGMVSQEHFSR